LQITNMAAYKQFLAKADEAAKKARCVPGVWLWGKYGARRQSLYRTLHCTRGGVTRLEAGVRVLREIETAEELERMRREGANYKPRAQREAEAKARRVPTTLLPPFIPLFNGTHTRLRC